MANIIGIKKYPTAIVKGPDGKVVRVHCTMTDKQKHFLETKFEETKNYEKRNKNN